MLVVIPHCIPFGFYLQKEWASKVANKCLKLAQREFATKSVTKDDESLKELGVCIETATRVFLIRILKTRQCFI